MIKDSPKAMKMLHPIRIRIRKELQKLQHLGQSAILDATPDIACVNPRCWANVAHIIAMRAILIITKPP